MKKILQNIVKLINHNESFVLVTILNQFGSAPRKTGTRMLVRSNGRTNGTIGGGPLEGKVLKLAREVMGTKNPIVRHFMLTNETNPDADMICGGEIEILIDYIEASDENIKQLFAKALTLLEGDRKVWWITEISGDENIQKSIFSLASNEGIVYGAVSYNKRIIGELISNARGRNAVLVQIDSKRFLVEPLNNNCTVYIFGGGHISQQLAMLTIICGFRTIILDDRPEMVNRERFPLVDDIIVLESFESYLNKIQITKESYIVVLTRSHLQDKNVLSSVLKTEACYIGMIGSRNKRDIIYKTLLEGGYTKGELQRIHTPIGLSIGAESPEEVAISIIAELIKTRSKR